MRRLCLLLCVLLAGCTTYRDRDMPIAAQAEFDPARYLGLWYEVARYPVSFEEGCTATTAEYGRIDAETVSVVNTCRQGSPDGPEEQIAGTAEIVGPGQLEVSFDIVAADYWVLWVDDAYETAVVGVPSGRAGWILARTPQISESRRARAEEALVANGYDPDRLMEVQHAAP